MPDFLVALEQQPGGGNVADRGDAAHIVVMEAVHEPRIVGDRERIVDTARIGQRLMDAHGVAELPEQHDQPRTVAGNIGGFVQDDVDAVGAPRKQQLPQQFVALRRIETAPDVFVEDTNGVCGVRDQLIERLFAGDCPFEHALTGHAFGRNGLHRIYPAQYHR